MTLLAILTAVTRYRQIVSDLGSAPIDIEQGRHSSLVPGAVLGVNLRARSQKNTKEQFA